VDGSDLHALTSNQGENWSPSWSPDGAYLVFQTNRDGNWEIYLMNADGSNPHNLTNNPADDQYPNLKP
jgi:TolB protein